MMKLRSVQALRALAALAVLMCHLHAIEDTKAAGPPLISDFWINGAAGVDLFFVISGFIMVWVAGETPRSFRHSAGFLFARIARIYPLWWLFAGLIASYFLITYGQPCDPARIGNDPHTGLHHLVDSFLLLPQAHHPVLGVGWTLVHEMYFYIIFTLIIFMVPSRFRLLALSLWGAGLTLGALAGLSGPVAKSFIQLIFYPMSLQFLMGALVAYAVRTEKGLRLAPLTALAGLTGLICVFILFDFETGGQLLAGLAIDDIGSFTLGWGRTLFFGLPAALLLHGLVALEIRHSAGRFIPSSLVHSGDWSYALYLSHILVLSAVARLYFALIDNDATRILDNIGFLCLASLAAIGFSAYVHKWIEKPMIRWYQGLRKHLIS